MRRRNIYGFSKWFEVLILTSFVFFNSFGETLLTLENALEMCEKNSYISKNGQLDVDYSIENEKVALSLYYPQINLSLGHIHLDNDPEVKFGYFSFPLGEQLFWKWDFELKYTIYDFGRRKSYFEASRSATQATKSKVSQEVRNKLAEVASIYMESLTLKEQINVVEKRKETLIHHYETTKNLYEQGVLTRNEVLRSEVALRSIETQKQLLLDTLNSLLDKMKILLSIDMKEKIDILPIGSKDFSIEEIPKLIENEDVLLKNLLQNNETLKSLDEKVKALTENYNFSKKEYYPIVVGALGQYYEQNRYMVYPHRNQLFLGISWNIFDGGQKRAKLKERQIEVEKAKLEREEAEKELISSLQSALRDYKRELNVYETQSLNVKAAFENLKIVEANFGEGLLKTTDFLEAESLYAESLFRQIESLYKAISLEAKIVALTGSDLKSFFNFKQKGGN